MPRSNPRAEVGELTRRMGTDAGENIGEPGWWIDTVHFAREDQAVHGRGAPYASIGPAVRTSSKRWPAGLVGDTPMECARCSSGADHEKRLDRATSQDVTSWFASAAGIASCARLNRDR